MIRNLSYGGKWIQIHWFADPKIVDVQNNLVDEDPHFVDAASMDFQLRDDSPAYELGFKRIPAEKIGLYFVDLCEFNEKVILYYSWGNQHGIEHLAQAVYEGTLESFFKGFFPV